MYPRQTFLHKIDNVAGGVKFQLAPPGSGRHMILDPRLVTGSLSALQMSQATVESERAGEVTIFIAAPRSAIGMPVASTDTATAKCPHHC